MAKKTYKTDEPLEIEKLLEQDEKDIARAEINLLETKSPEQAAKIEKAKQVHKALSYVVERIKKNG